MGVPGPTSDLPPPPIGGWATPPPISRDLVVRTRIADGVLTGLAFAAIGGLLWWGIVAATNKDLPYLAVVVGLFAGQGVLVGARRGGPVQAGIAALFCVVALVVAQYFVLRTVRLDTHANDYLPLWTGFSNAKTLVKDSLQDHKINAVYWLVALVLAVISTVVPRQRSVLG
jgi:hypothetical protein